LPAVGSQLNQVMLTTPLQLSVAVAWPSAVLTSGLNIPEQLTDTSGGQVMTGPTLSITLMVCAQVAVLPQTSAAFHVLVIR
jgi:hypothetical protein